jgi:hypothetical protein
MQQPEAATRGDADVTERGHQPCPGRRSSP